MKSSQSVNWLKAMWSSAGPSLSARYRGSALLPEGRRTLNSAAPRRSQSGGRCDLRHLFHACAAGLAVGLLSTPSHAVQLAFEFHGVVSVALEDPFGRAVPFDAPVTGRFVFETDSVATHPNAGCDCVGYAQQIVNGFAADMGGVAIRADEYLVEVSNDVEFSPGEAYDYFTIRWESELTPALASPLLVNGAAYTDGLFSVSLNAFPELFDSPALPDAIVPEDYVFPSEFNPLGDYDPVPGNVDVLFDVASIERRQFFGGDFDFDEAVGGLDLLAWQRQHFDGAGLSAWEETFGSSPPSAGDVLSVPTPEPLGPCLFVAAWLAVDRQARRTTGRAATTAR